VTLLRTIARHDLSIDDLRVARDPVLVEHGKNDEGLIIAFTGMDDRLFLRVYDFFEATKGAGYSRILLRDKHRLWYHHGIDRRRRDFSAVLEYLQSEIKLLRPQKLMCIGTSSAGYAALVAGYLLGADYVHAFAPQTLLDVSIGTIRKSRFKRSRLRLRFSRRARRDWFDVRALLGIPNGKTTYFVHHCAGAARDREYARRIAGLPGVVVMAYPCTAHAIGIYLAKRGFLKHTLDFSTQEKLPQLAKAEFRDGIHIDGDDVLALGPHS
jgi:hypothetical protein